MLEHEAKSSQKTWWKLALIYFDSEVYLAHTNRLNLQCTFICIHQFDLFGSVYRSLELLIEFTCPFYKKFLTGPTSLIVKQKHLNASCQKAFFEGGGGGRQEKLTKQMQHALQVSHLFGA